MALHFLVEQAATWGRARERTSRCQNNLGVRHGMAGSSVVADLMPGSYARAGDAAGLTKGRTPGAGGTFQQARSADETDWAARSSAKASPGPLFTALDAMRSTNR